jgi:hypothetical protein
MDGYCAQLDRPRGLYSEWSFVICHIDITKSPKILQKFSSYFKIIFNFYSERPQY